MNTESSRTKEYYLEILEGKAICCLYRMMPKKPVPGRGWLLPETHCRPIWAILLYIFRWLTMKMTLRLSTFNILWIGQCLEQKVPHVTPPLRLYKYCIFSYRLKNTLSNFSSNLNCGVYIIVYKYTTIHIHRISSHRKAWRRMGWKSLIYSVSKSTFKGWSRARLNSAQSELGNY